MINGLKIASFLMLSLSYGCGDLDSSDLDHDQAMPGETGAQGEAGAAGEKGATGAQGPMGKYTVLVDQKGVEVGQYLERVDFVDNRFEIMTMEGYRTVINLDDASIAPPNQLGGAGISCIYESNDCTGACFGFDVRARGYVLIGQDGKIFSVDSNAVAQNITFNSFNEMTALGNCAVQNGVLPTAVPSQAYNGVLTQTLTAPLYFKISNPAGE